MPIAAWPAEPQPRLALYSDGEVEPTVLPRPPENPVQEAGGGGAPPATWRVSRVRPSPAREGATR